MKDSDITPKSDGQNQPLSESEQRYQQLVETIPHGIQECDTDGLITFTNRAYAKMLGYEEGELIGKHIWDMIDDETEKNKLRKYLAFLVDEQPPPTPYFDKNQTKNGSIIDIQVDWTYKRDEKDNVTGFISVITDITVRKQAEESLKQSHDELEQNVEERTSKLAQINQRLKEEIEVSKGTQQELQLSTEIIENMAVGVNFVRVSDRTLVYTNPTFDEIFGYEQGELTGKHVSILNAPNDRTPMQTTESIIASLKEKGTWFGEIHNVRKDGSFFWTSTTITAFEHPVFGTVWISVQQDITQRRITERALRQSEARFSAFIEHFPGVVFMKDTQGRHIFANVAFEQLFQIERDDWYLKTNDEVFPTDVSTRFDEHDQKVMQEGAHLQFVEMTKYAEEERQWLVHKFPIKDDLGISFLLGGMAIDVTERMQAEQKLHDSELRMSSLLEGSPVCIKMIDLDSRLQYMSAAGQNQLKISDITPFYDCTFPPDLYPESMKILMNEHLDRAKAGETSFTECRVHDTEGTEIWYDTTFTPAHDENGDVKYIIVTSVNITEHKQVEMELRNREARLRTIMTSSLDPMITTDIHGIIDSVSNSVEKIFSWKPAEVIGKNVKMLVPEPHQSQHDGYLEKFHRFGKSNIICNAREVKGLRKDGSLFPCTITINRAYLPGQPEPIFLGIIRDISEQKQAEEHARQQQDQLTHVSRLSIMGEMATGIAHEINQPLAAIGNYAYAGEEALQKEGILDTQHLRDIFQAISEQSIRAGDIIRRLRSFVKKTVFQREIADLNNVIRDVADMIKPEFIQHSIHLYLNLNGSFSQVLIDTIQIQQVLINLLTNAIDAMQGIDQAKRIVTLTVSESESQMVEVTVCDSGKGIQTDVADKLFDAFFTTKESGLGMGLAISQSIIENHGGRLWCESNADGGTTFRFTLQRSTTDDNTR